MVATAGLHDKPQPQNGQKPAPRYGGKCASPSGPEGKEEEEESALTRRFTAMAEDAITSSPHKAYQITNENAFSSDLKQELESRIARAEFASTHAQALSVASLPSTAPKHARDIAASAPWTGTESTEDVVLRMLVDAHKPLRGELARKPSASPSPTPNNIDLRPARSFKPQSTPQRLARAREESTKYSLGNAEGLSESERAEVRNMFRERFLPEGRAISSLNAIASLADEKIEEARARGQFKNLPRGKPLERDHNADSPYLDTTEYFMNRIIQKQDIVPPWIEKQQDLAKAVRLFRERLMGEWKRHVARAIASSGGSLEDQCRRAEEYASGEARLARIEESAKKPERGMETDPSDGDAAGKSSTVFRDPTWEKAGLQYHKLAIESLNSTTRSYNLMAPELAKKPYFILERELKRCYRESAPLIAQEIREQAGILVHKPMEPWVQNSGSLFEKVGGARNEAIHDSALPNYGVRELLRDILGRWKRGSQAS